MARPSQVVQGYEPDTVEKDDSWVLPLRVQFHTSLTCWKRTGSDPDDPDSIEKDIVRCAPDWGGQKDNSWYDFVWVQEYAIDGNRVEGRPESSQSNQSQ